MEAKRKATNSENNSLGTKALHVFSCNNRKRNEIFICTMYGLKKTERKGLNAYMLLSDRIWLRRETSKNIKVLFAAVGGVEEPHLQRDLGCTP